MKHTAIGATCVLALLVAGCTTSPAEYSAKLPAQDAKWNTAECRKMRAAAATYDANEKKTMGVAAGMVFGPYGVAIALAGKEYKAKQRKLFVRDMHIACSSRPLPPDLQNLTGKRAS
jgi:hypothetical protein